MAFGHTGDGIDRNLLIVHTPTAEDISDFAEIKRRIEQSARDIEVRIATNGARNSVTMRWQVSRPSLIFSPCAIQECRPKGGTIYQGIRFTKLEQIERHPVEELAFAPRVVRADGPHMVFDAIGSALEARPGLRLRARAHRLVVAACPRSIVMRTSSATDSAFIFSMTRAR